jgi:type IV secretion system protein TrbG
MRRTYIIAASLLVTMAVPAVAQAKSPRLTSAQATGSDLSRQWRQDRGIIAPGSDGKIQILYGASQPQIVCAPLQVCDIELQEGEQVLNVNVGDVVRWKVSAARSGEGRQQRVHLIVKPVTDGIGTSMVVTTSRRVYHLALRAAKYEYMARVGFVYPDENSVSAADLESVNPVAPTSKEESRQAGSGLDFAYKIKGDARWKPERVYNDGLKTYIDMPKTMDSTEAPALLVMDDSNSEKLVNYRIVDRRYVVDQLFDRAALMAGVGRKQTRITISRVR